MGQHEHERADGAALDAPTYYNERANWSLIPPHMREGVRLYVMRGVPMGSFGMAIMANDLLEAVGRADDSNREALPGWAAFIYNYTPIGSHGSPEAVSAWIASGGLAGRP